MKLIIKISILIAAIIHLIPVIGVFGAEKLAVLYGLDFSEANLLILMSHRAVLFALLGLFLLYSVFKTPLQLLAIIAGLISAISFIVLAWVIGGYNELIAQVMIADVVASASLVLALILHFLSSAKQNK